MIGDDDYTDQTRSATADKRGQIALKATLRKIAIKLDAALNGFELHVPGDFLYADENSTGTATIQLNNTSENDIPFRAATLVEGVPMDFAYITAAAQAGLVLNLWFGYRGRIRPPNALSPLGADGALLASSLTTAGFPRGPDFDTALDRAYAVTSSIAASAGNFSLVGFVNPVGSGKRGYIDQLVIWQSVVSTVRILSSDALQQAIAQTPFSRRAGGAAAVCFTRSGNPAGIIGVALDGFQLPPVALTSFVFQPPRPYIVDPGTGIYIESGIVNTLLGVNFAVREY